LGEIPGRREIFGLPILKKHAKGCSGQRFRRRKKEKKITAARRDLAANSPEILVHRGMILSRMLLDSINPDIGQILFPSDPVKRDTDVEVDCCLFCKKTFLPELEIECDEVILMELGRGHLPDSAITIKKSLCKHIERVHHRFQLLRS
jgi:hypothetical protein